MDESEKKKILARAKDWWRDEFAAAHAKKTVSLERVDQFQQNPFLWTYLAYFLEGESTPESLARILVYPRVLGTSPNTIFGTRMQQLVTKLFEGTLGSSIHGMDLEFTDKLDGRLKYCQLKSGPNIVNSSDVITINNHFKDARNIARTNGLSVGINDYVLCILYGEPWQKNGNIKKIEEDYTVLIGREFWHHFTGDPDFYSDLIDAIGEVANEFNMKDGVKKVVKSLAEDIKKKYPDLLS